MRCSTLTPFPARAAAHSKANTNNRKNHTRSSMNKPKSKPAAKSSDLIRFSEAATKAGVARTTIYNWIKSGLLSAVSTEGGRKVSVAELLKVAGNSQTQADVKAPTKRGRGRPRNSVQQQPPAVAAKAAPPAGLPKPHQKATRGKTSVSDKPPATELEAAGVRKVKLADITLDPDVQARACLNEETVAEYAQKMKEGEKFPPVQLFSDEKTCYVGDGWHRLAAAASLGYTSFPAVVSPGGRSAALRFALGANALHGLPRTNADKLRAIEIACREFPKMSSRAIAEMCAVSDRFVGEHRTWCERFAPEARVGKDGKAYRVNALKTVKMDEGQRLLLMNSSTDRALKIVGQLDKPHLVKVREAVDARLGAVEKGPGNTPAQSPPPAQPAESKEAA